MSDAVITRPEARDLHHRLAGFAAVLAVVVGLFAWASPAQANTQTWFCPADGSTKALDPGIEGTCVYGYKRTVKQVSVYRLNNTSVRHCGGGHDSESRWGNHNIGYACGIGQSPNGWLATPYTGGVSSHPIHKNSDCCTYHGFYGYFLQP